MLPVELVTWEKRPSVLADSFRATLSSILYSGDNGKRPRLIVVTSANPNEGKTTVVSNLALALAEMGRRVDALPLDRYPTVRRMLPMLLGHHHDQPFEYGLEALLDGLAARRAYREPIEH